MTVSVTDNLWPVVAFLSPANESRLIEDRFEIPGHRSSVVCCSPANVTQLCIEDDVTEPITSVSIVFSPMTRITMTSSVWRNLGVSDVSAIERIRVSNSSFNSLYICRNMADREAPRSDELKDRRSAGRPKRYVTVSPARYENSLMTTESPAAWSEEFLELIVCEDFVELKEVDISGNHLKVVREMLLPNLQKLHIAGNHIEGKVFLVFLLIVFH